MNSIITKTAVGDLALKIPTLPLTKLTRYPQYQEAIDDFIHNGNVEKIVANVEIRHAQEVFEDLIGPWQEMARKHLEDVPDSPAKKLLEQVPVAFANELISTDKN